jgi:hypothetical protein
LRRANEQKRYVRFVSAADV